MPAISHLRALRPLRLRPSRLRPLRLRPLRLLRALLPAALFAAVACENFWQPTVPENRRDPGTVVVQVRDTAGTPIANVWVYIELPNTVGSTFWEGTPTNSEGRVTHRVIPAGSRVLEVKPPAGFIADTPRQFVEVVKDKTTNAEFVLRRQ
jgi:hypothetical protein